MKALVGAFNQEKALVGAFSVIVKTGCGTDGSFYSTNEDCFLYRAAVTRDTATMTALVSVSPAHPATPPLWCLCLMGGEEHLTQVVPQID